MIAGRRRPRNRGSLLDMVPISWPMAIVIVAVVVVAGGLAAMHVISADWIEHTLSAVAGLVLGHSIGIMRGKRDVPAVPPPAAASDSSSSG
jgi:hypothetical protein